MESLGRGHRGGGRGNNRMPPTFDQQAFMEASGAATATIVQANVAAATIVHASETASQGGSSNLQRFKAHHPPTFMGVSDPMVADHWFRQVEKILEASEITFDALRIRLVAFHLEGESQVWWNRVKASRDLEAMTWKEFRELFMDKYFLASARHTKARELLELKQGTMTMLEYVAKFTELAILLMIKWPPTWPK